MSDLRAHAHYGCLLAGLLWPHPALAAGSEFECLVEPSRVIEVASSGAGVLDEVLVERGDRVEAGQLIARLQSDVEQKSVDLAKRRVALHAAIDSAIAQIEFQKLELERRRELRKRDHLSARDLEEAETQTRVLELRLEELRENRELAKLELERARAALELKGIRSRDAGLVVERFKNPGEYVEEEPIVRLAVVSPLHVEIVLPVEMLGEVEEGRTAKVRPEAPVGGEFVGTVTVVDDVVDPATSTFRVRLELPNGGNELPAGLRCLVRFDPPGKGLAIDPKSGEPEGSGPGQGESEHDGQPAQRSASERGS